MDALEIGEIRNLPASLQFLYKQKYSCKQTHNGVESSTVIVHINTRIMFFGVVLSPLSF